MHLSLGRLEHSRLIDTQLQLICNLHATQPSLAIFHPIHEGCTGHGLPPDVPAWQTLYKYFHFWQQLGSIGANQSYSPATGAFPGG